MKLPHLLLVVLLSIAAAFVTAHFIDTHKTAAAAPETTFDRVMRTNTLRCGYATASPWFMVDPNTHAMTGVAYDVTNAVAAKIGVKVKWAEETGWGVAEQGLADNRYDMMCGNVCIDPRRARAATYSTPFLHIPILAVVRTGNTRFDEGLKAINSPDTKIGVRTGHIFEFIANEQFPKAQKVYTGDLADDSEFFLMLASGKIDVAFGVQDTVDHYNEKNPDKIRTLGEAVRFCNAAFMLPLGDERFKDIVDNALMEINTSGQIETMISHYTKLDPRYVRAPAMPFQEK